MTRLVLRNPGTLKLPLSKIIEGGSSKARNPRMQNMLRMIGYGENIGLGFPQIMNAWKIAGWKEPILEDKWDLQEVQLTVYVTKEDVVKGVVKDGSGVSHDTERIVCTPVRRYYCQEGWQKGRILGIDKVRLWY